jgi:DNA-directed RNA polymerase specialized sigma24 family protein
MSVTCIIKWGEIMEHLMEYTLLALVFFSLLLLTVSFFAKDKFKTLEEQIDHLTMSFVQETYQMKKKLKVLEEELLMSDEDVMEIVRKKAFNDSLEMEREQVFALYKQGLSYEQIAKETSLTTEEVRMILQQRLRGMN